MRHLVISREFPPASYPAGGIGTYVANIARLLAQHGDTVHIIGERWDGAPKYREVLCGGRLVIHRVGAGDIPAPLSPADASRMERELEGLQESPFPAQWFGWSAAFLAEKLVREEAIDVIEAQEWEAPLYYFLLRRSIGLGPDRQPPCVVHLHSPSAFIHHYNGPAVAPASLGHAKRMEEFCIQSADALLCPSQSLAIEAAKHYRIQHDITVIPLPVGFTRWIDRDEAIWRDGAICFVGRLEPRKGVIEWVEAAMRVALENPTVHFDFVGSDIWDLQNALVKQIGRDLAPRFRFHGAKPKDELALFLANAKAGVVPSRWENFPNTCVEAMASGLPVIATRFGGMAEMVEDDRTGWLAEDTGVAGMVGSLAEALRRCLATSAEQRATMGAAAAQAIRRMCANEAVIEAHRRFRDGVVRGGALRSGVKSSVRSLASAYVIIRSRTLQECENVLHSVAAQTAPPKVIAVVYQENSQAGRLPRVRVGCGTDLVLHQAPTKVGTEAWNDGVSLLASRGSPDFWLFLDSHDSLAPACLEKMAGVFSVRPDVGVVTPWTDRMGAARYLDARPSPALIFQMCDNDVSPASGFRAQAIGAGPPFSPGLCREYDVWELSNKVIAAGWAAVTLPSLLAERAAPATETSWLERTALRAVRAQALAAFAYSDENRLALEIVDTYVPLTQHLPSNNHSPSTQGLRNLVLRSLEAALFRPRHLIRRCLAASVGLFVRGALKL